MEQTIRADILNSFPPVDQAAVEALLRQEIDASDVKFIVLDDDPTGVQTVHDVSGLHGLVRGEHPQRPDGARQCLLHPDQQPRPHGGADHCRPPGDLLPTSTPRPRPPASATSS